MHNHSNGNELRILMQIKLISLTIVEHQDSLRNRDKQQLGNGPLAPIEVLSFILDTESLIGIMGNEHISCRTPTHTDSNRGNVCIITPSLNHETTTSLTARMSFFINVNNFHFQKCCCKRVSTPAEKQELASLHSLLPQVLGQSNLNGDGKFTNLSSWQITQ